MTATFNAISCTGSVAHAIGATSSRGLHLAVPRHLAVDSRSLCGALGGRPAETALLIVAVVIAHPVTTVLLSWLGTPDVLSFAASAVVLCRRRRHHRSEPAASR